MRKVADRNKLKPLPPVHYAIHGVLIVISIIFMLPMLLVVSASLTSEDALIRNGYSFLPSVFSLEAYNYLFADPAQLLRAYGISVLVGGLGSGLSLLAMALLAYPLSRKEFPYSKVQSFIVFFTMLFNGGIVASYIINTRYLGLSDSLLALILPYLIVPFYVLLLRTFFAGLPSEIIEAARIDGASEWRIFFRIVLPLSTPALATIGLFSLLLYWNDYILGLLYLDSPSKYPLQLLLFNILNNIEFLSKVQTSLATTVAPPTQTVRMAMAVLATGPIAFAFLFLQRYFVRGLTLGSLKG
jgi:putative aldouronate transport system permease protein